MQYYVDKILEEKSIISFLSDRGINPVKTSGDKSIYLCPIHKGDSDPSFVVYPAGTKGINYETYYCFGCIEENELIWTRRGLKKIIDIEVGNEVLDMYGEFVKVKKNKISNKNIYGLKLGCFSEPLFLTSDHICIYLPKEDALKAFPYIGKNGDNIFFSNKAKKRKRTQRYKNKLNFLNFRENKLKQVKENDFFAFPVIKEQKRNNKDLINKSILKEYTKGPRSKRIIGLKANSNVAFIIGIWLAEGSVCSQGRVIRWTFNIDEKNIAQKLMKFIWNEFELKSQFREYPNKKTCEVDCCNVDMAKQFIYWFGKGSDNKQIPIEILSWTKNLQLELINAFVLGDGDKLGRQCYTASQKLAYSLFCLSIQSGKFPYLTPRKARIDKNGVKHKKSYCVGFSSKERMNGFYETIQGSIYYICKIKEIKNYNRIQKVVDIEVEKSHSFVTKMGMVHNCHSGINIINLKRDLDDTSSKDSIKFFLDDMNINKMSVMESIINDIKEGKLIIENDKSIEMLLLRINTWCHTHLVNYNDSEERGFFSLFLKKVDDVARSGNLELLQAIYSLLLRGIDKRAKGFNKRKEEQSILATSWGSI